MASQIPDLELGRAHFQEQLNKLRSAQILRSQASKSAFLRAAVEVVSFLSAFALSCAPEITLKQQIIMSVAYILLLFQSKSAHCAPQKVA